MEFLFEDSMIIGMAWLQNIKKIVKLKVDTGAPVTIMRPETVSVLTSYPVDSIKKFVHVNGKPLFGSATKQEILSTPCIIRNITLGLIDG